MNESKKALEASNLFAVKGKNVLVTGGGQGIGLMIAAGFVRNGANVFISSRSDDKCKKVAAQLSAMGPGTCMGIGSDLSSVAGIKTLMQALKDQGWEKLHVLVNNSGASWGEPLETHSEKGWDKVMNINLRGLFFLCQAALPFLEAAASDRDPARIINVGSIVGIQHSGGPTFGYDASKAAVHGLTRHLAATLAPKRITANVLAPGLVPTKMGSQLFTYESEDAFKGRIPLGRFGETTDMAGPALFFASPAGAWVTGAVLPVDGGQLQRASL